MPGTTILPARWHARAERGLVPPEPRADVVGRPLLLERLRQLTHRCLTLIVAPTGYGKTTLLAQWACEERRPVAWLALTGADAAPQRFFARIGAAVMAARPELVVSPGEADTPALALDLLAEEIAGAPGSLVVVLDDYHLVDEACSAPLGEALERLPPNLHLVVSSRIRPALPAWRLAAAGELGTLGPDDLRLDRAEIAEVARRVNGSDLDPGGRAALERRTEGWPAGVRLAVAARRDGVAEEYLRDEVLARQSPELRHFLLRTSVLDRLTPAGCDALLDRHDSARLLDDLELAGVLVVADGGARRYHRQLLALLRGELRREAPEATAELHRRAAHLCERAGETEAAVRHTIAAADTRGARALVIARIPELIRLHRVTGVATLLDALGVDDTIRDPALTLARAWVAAASDAPEAEVERLLGLGSGRPRGPLPFRSGDPAAESAVVRAARMGLDAGERVRRAETAACALAASAGAPAARTVDAQVAVALLLAGRCDDALAAAGALPVDPGVAPAAAAAVAAVRSLALGRLGRHAEAAGPARASAALASSFDIDEPLAQLALGCAEHDEQLLWQAARSHPAMRAWALAELALLRAADDRNAARALVDEAHALLADVADPGLPGAVAAEADGRLRSAARVQSRQETELSRAELRVLRLLPSRLTQREIACELYLSLNTVKTHACAIYRKLGVTSRPDAVRAARALNLV